MSADVTDSQQTAQCGAALLDAARTAESWSSDNGLLMELSESGRFETMPGRRARFLETSEVRAAVQRPLAGAPMSGDEILALVVEAARGQ